MVIDWNAIQRVAHRFSRDEDVYQDIIVEIAEEAAKKEMTKERMERIARTVVWRHQREHQHYAQRFSSLNVLVESENGKLIPLEETIPSNADKT